MGTLEPSCSAGGNAKWCSSCGTVWWLLNTVNTELPKDPAISLLGIDPKALKTGIQTHTCTSMFCFEEPTGGASPRPSTEEWVHKRGPSARWARSSDARCPLLGGAPGTATPSGSCQPREAGVTRFLLYKTSRAGTASGTEQLVPTGGWGGGIGRLLIGYQFPSGVMKTFWNRMAEMTTQHCECTKYHRVICLR